MDFKIIDQGSLVGFMPLNEAAERWWEENVASEDFQWMGPVCYCEHRSASALIGALRENGFELGV